MAAPRLLRPSLLRLNLQRNIPTVPRLTPTLSATTTNKLTQKQFSSTPIPQSESKMTPTDTLIELAKGRRTIYQLGKNSPVSDAKIEELVNAAILNVPSSFNTQSTRLLVLLHQEHEKMWDLVIAKFEELVKSGTVPEEVWKKQTLPKLLGMKGAVGTVSFVFPSLLFILLGCSVADNG